MSYSAFSPTVDFDTVEVADTTGMEFLSANGAFYYLEYTTDLVAPTNWTATGATIAGNGDTLILFDPTGTDTSKTYRILMSF